MESIVVAFAPILDNLPLEKSETIRSFSGLIAPKSSAELDRLAGRARALTRQHFGRTMRLFAPLYLSNECINSCRYCGFSRENPILRVTLSVDEVVKEARHLSAAGFRQLLLVAGEHPRFVSRDYLAESVRTLRDDFSSISIEVAPMETEEYIPIVEAGAEGLVVYQETYHRAIYDQRQLVYQLCGYLRAYSGIVSGQDWSLGLDFDSLLSRAYFHHHIQPNGRSCCHSNVVLDLRLETRLFYAHTISADR